MEPSELAKAHLAAKERLQAAVVAGITAIWRGLGHYNREQVDQWLATVLPLTAAANRQSVALTRAFVARATGTPPTAINVDQLLAGIRNGTPPSEVYTRPFITVWGALGRGTPWAQAARMGLDRATGAASTDVQLSFTHTLTSVGDAGGRIAGWQRVPDAQACDFCTAAAQMIYSTGDLLPLHTWCGCGVMPLMAADLRAPVVPPPDRFDTSDGVTVAVRDHGELGPVLTNAADHFAGPGDLAGHNH